MMETSLMGNKTGTCDSILDAIGNTPMVRLPRDFDPEIKCEVLLKLDYMNPGGSMKDRIALHMVRQAEKRGELKPGGRIVECSSGNTGAGLCIVAAALGYDITIVIPDKMSSEKISALRALGADVVVTPCNVDIEDPMHYTKVAGRIADETPGSWWPDQYHNSDNTDAHYYTTGPEIWEQAGGKIDYFVAGAGTGGTISGIARYLKEQDPNITIVGVDPPGSILAHFWKTGEICESGPYAVEGVGEEEVPRAWDPSVIDDYKVIADSDSFAMARKLASSTGMFPGGSGGMNMAAVLEVARGLPADARVVTLLPDYGKAYLSKVYSVDWLRDCGYLPQVPAATATVADLVHENNRARVYDDETLAWAIRQAGERGVRPLAIIARDGEGLLGILDEDKAIGVLSQGSDLEMLKAGDFVTTSPAVLELDQPWKDAVDALASHEAVLVKMEDGGFATFSRQDLMQGLKRLSH
ncbi:MAG: cystathionine beta-synthase [Planctomycetota bacterium]|nr:MAG: cystathionine beta-synthase [Planctomycetota bacterium]